MEDLLNDAIEQFKAIADDKRVLVTSKVKEISPRPKGDREALREALVNLIDNALKHSPEGATVNCGAEIDPQRTGRWRLWVEDHGPGVENEERTQIFEAFYRVGSEL